MEAKFKKVLKSPTKKSISNLLANFQAHIQKLIDQSDIVSLSNYDTYRFLATLEIPEAYKKAFDTFFGDMLANLLSIKQEPSVIVVVTAFFEDLLISNSLSSKVYVGEKTIFLLVDVLSDSTLSSKIRRNAIEVLNHLLKRCNENKRFIDADAGSSQTMKKIRYLIPVAGDIELQLRITEFVFRLIPKAPSAVEKFTTNLHLEPEFFNIRHECFWKDARIYLWGVNRKLSATSKSYPKTFKVHRFQYRKAGFKSTVFLNDKQDIWLDFNTEDASITPEDDAEVLTFPYGSVTEYSFSEAEEHFLKLKFSTHSLIKPHTQSSAAPHDDDAADGAYSVLLEIEKTDDNTTTKIMEIMESKAIQAPTLVLPNRHKISRPFEDFASQGAASVKSSGHRSEGYDNQMLDDGTQPLIDDGDNHVGDNGGDDKDYYAKESEESNPIFHTKTPVNDTSATVLPDTVILDKGKKNKQFSTMDNKRLASFMNDVVNDYEEEIDEEQPEIQDEKRQSEAQPKVFEKKKSSNPLKTPVKLSEKNTSANTAKSLCKVADTKPVTPTPHVVQPPVKGSVRKSMKTRDGEFVADIQPEMVSDKMSKEAKKSSAKSVVSSKVNASKKINGAKKAKISDECDIPKSDNEDPEEEYQESTKPKTRKSASRKYISKKSASRNSPATNLANTRKSKADDASEEEDEGGREGVADKVQVKEMKKTGNKDLSNKRKSRNAEKDDDYDEGAEMKNQAEEKKTSNKRKSRSGKKDDDYVEESGEKKPGKVSDKIQMKKARKSLAIKKKSRGGENNDDYEEEQDEVLAASNEAEESKKTGKASANKRRSRGGEKDEVCEEQDVKRQQEVDKHKKNTGKKEVRGGKKVDNHGQEKKPGEAENIAAGGEKIHSLRTSKNPAGNKGLDVEKLRKSGSTSPHPIPESVLLVKKHAESSSKEHDISIKKASTVETIDEPPFKKRPVVHYQENESGEDLVDCRTINDNDVAPRYPSSFNNRTAEVEQSRVTPSINRKRKSPDLQQGQTFDSDVTVIPSTIRKSTKKPAMKDTYFSTSVRSMEIEEEDRDGYGGEKTRRRIERYEETKSSYRNANSGKQLPFVSSSLRLPAIGESAENVNSSGDESSGEEDREIDKIMDQFKKVVARQKSAHYPIISTALIPEEPSAKNKIFAQYKFDKGFSLMDDDSKLSKIVSSDHAMCSDVLKFNQSKPQFSYKPLQESTKIPHQSKGPSALKKKTGGRYSTPYDYSSSSIAFAKKENTDRRSLGSIRVDDKSAAASAGGKDLALINQNFCKDVKNVFSTFGDVVVKKWMIKMNKVQEEIDNTCETIDDIVSIVIDKVRVSQVQSFTDLSKQLFKNQDSVQQIKHNHVEARNHLDTLYNKTLNSLRDIGDPKSDDALRSFV